MPNPRDNGKVESEKDEEMNALNVLYLMQGIDKYISNLALISKL
jgi:hypothetical protein